MIDYIAQGQECKNKAEDDMIGGLFTTFSKFDAAAEFYHKAATSFKLVKSWDQAGSTYIKLAECHLKTDNLHEAAAAAYVDAANCYRKISPIQAISCLEQVVNLFCNIGRFSMAARYCKEVGEIYEQLRDFEEGIKHFERAAELFQVESPPSANQCKQKVAQFSAQLKQYMKAIEIFEEVAQEAINSNLMRYEVRGHLLNAGVCHLCKGNIVAVRNALERYQVLDPAFSRTRENDLLTELVAAYDEQDVEKFTEVLKDYDSLSPLDPWKTILLLRIKEDLKAKIHEIKSM